MEVILVQEEEEEEEEVEFYLNARSGTSLIVSGNTKASPGHIRGKQMGLLMCDNQV